MPEEASGKVEIPLEGLYGKAYFPPTPVCLVTAVNEDGWTNVAPISQLLYISYDGGGWPKAVIIGISSYQGGRRKVRRIYQNIMETRQFVVNFPTEDMAAKINKLAEGYPDGFDKFRANGLTAIASLRVKPPSVKECKIHMECELSGQLSLGLQHDLVIGRVVCVTADRELTQCSDEERVALMRPLYWYGMSPTKGEYYSIGRATGTLESK